MHKKETFGEVIRHLREDRGLPIRKVAAHLDIDPSTLSKIERNERSANREHIRRLSELFQINEKELLIDYLSDKVSYELLEEENSSEILQVAEEKIKYIRSKKETQGEIKFK